ncbi:tetratricopeptide repeat protein [Paenibacillus sp.]|uniref:tetratricopeptide repeat protein n=1 Tax=Paenibacillus sp. TaxID=58172 RepID=UPI002D5B5D95|nr:tetratricopeptide repeat protein [Paenibacillus sp.]HZG85280.1 tetratricopeptide repeat protein [Paenibacillus sp.]
MFKYLFQSMNEKLDGILEALPVAHGTAKQALLRQLQELREISDGMIEEWLLFEEKLAQAGKRSSQPAAASPAGSAGKLFDLPAEASESPMQTMQYQRGEGYFKLYMFAEAAREFQAVVAKFPEFLQARLYLALCLLQNENVAEAYSHLQILISLADDGKMKAIAYNALGCVNAVKGNVDQACECFRTSHALDPNFQDPVNNLKACQTEGGVLHLGVAIG